MQRWLAEEVVEGLFDWRSGGTKDVGDSEGDGVDVEAEAAAVVGGEGGVAIDGDLEGVGEAVVLGDAAAGDDGGPAVAGGTVDLLIADGQIFVGVGLEEDVAEELDAETELVVGDGAEGGVVFVDEAIDEVTGVADAELDVGGETTEGALEVVGEVEGATAGGEAVGFVAGGRRDRDVCLIEEVAGDELGVEAEDDVSELAALVDEELASPGTGGEVFGQTIHVDGKGGVDAEDVVEAVADGGGCERGPAYDGVVNAY